MIDLDTIYTDEQACDYCDGTEQPIVAYELRGSVGYFHPACLEEMRVGGCSDAEEDEPFDPQPIGPVGGNA